MILVDHTIDISGIIENLTDRERLKWIKELIESTESSGTILEIRELANSENYDG